MVAFSDIIDFLLRLLSDETARTEFDKDPLAALGKAGLQGVSAVGGPETVEPVRAV